MTQIEILAALKAGAITIAEAATQLEAIDKPELPIHFKVGEKGGISLYGVQRQPVTLYWPQWERIMAHGDKLREFATTNADKLSKGKEDSKARGEAADALRAKAAAEKQAADVAAQAAADARNAKARTEIAAARGEVMA